MEKEYKVVAYIKMKSEVERLTYEEARDKALRLSLQQPENIYQIEEIEED
jgi:hypothetical protein